MPEGDVIHRLAATLDRLIVGHPCATSSPQGRFAAASALIDGWTPFETRAVGKHLFVGFAPVVTRDEGGHLHPADETHVEWLHVHLGLYGSWRFSGDASFRAPAHIGAPRTPQGSFASDAVGRPLRFVGTTRELAGEDPHQAVRMGVRNTLEPWIQPEPIGQVRLRIATDHGVADLTGPNQCELLSFEECKAIMHRLGPDPLAPGATTDAESIARFIQGVRRRKRPVGELLMDQTVISGVGNIYRAEALFLAGISPHRKGDRVSEKRLETLWPLICQLMEHGFEIGRIETMQAEDAPAEVIPSDPEASKWYVYHRTGRSCIRCGTDVKEQIMQGRRLFWCPSCQR